MNAAAAPVAVQPTLDGIAPPNVQAPVLAALEVGEPLKSAIQGTLAANAVVRTDSHNLVWLEVLITQRIEHHPHALPLFAAELRRDAGTIADTLDRAYRHAARLTVGTLVVVLGRGIEVGHHHGASVLRLIHTDGIDRADAIHPTQPGSGHAH